MPKHLPSGKRFHLGDHEEYNKWTKKAMTAINEEIVQGRFSENLLGSKMDELFQVLKTHLEDAYNFDRGIDEHFRLIGQFKLSDIGM